MRKFSILAAGIILLLSYGSCKKNKSIDLNPDVNAANDVILSVSSYTTIFNLMIKARLDHDLLTTGMAMIDKAVATFDPEKMEYGFTFLGDISPDSVRRSGNIRIALSGDILLKGSSALLTLKDYYEDEGLVGGTDSIFNEGVNGTGHLVFSNHVSGGVINKAVEGGTIHVSMVLSFSAPSSSLVSGQDILFLEQGTLSGLSSKGHSFSASFRDALQDALSCPWLKNGIIDLQVSDTDLPDGMIDFMTADGCSDVIWYYFGNSEFKVRKNKFFLKN
ncbi:MAG: hypothetical protein NTW10_09520 [Bacteroidetes bacterium]|nr:hypothetical protein [Bacteroidota bacterium]